MLYYWLLFGIFAAGTLFTATIPNLSSRRGDVLLAAASLFMLVLIGLRYEVGGDWQTYEWMFTSAGRLEFLEALDLGDPGYQALNWLVFKIGFDLWAVNLICAAFFTWGLFRFCLTQPLPWAAALVAVPYMVIVVAMGYTRQGVALGILMAGFAVFLRTGSSLRFAVYVFAAALFHKTAIVAFPLVALASQRNKFVNWLMVPALSLWLYDLFLGDAMDKFVSHYVHQHYSAQGAAIRVGMNLFAALVFFVLRRRLGFSEIERPLWRNFSFAAVLMMGLLVLLPSSAAVDRMAIYIIPLQLAVLARTPLLIRSRLPGTILLLGYAFAVQFVWLNFGQFSRLWLPYRFFPI